MCSLCGFVFILSLVHEDLPYGCSWKYISLSFQKVWGALKKAFDSRRAIVSLILLLSAPIRIIVRLSLSLLSYIYPPLAASSHTQTLVTVAVCVCCQECACVYYRRTTMLLLLLESMPRSLCWPSPGFNSHFLKLFGFPFSSSFIFTIILRPFFLTNTFGSSQK